MPALLVCVSTPSLPHRGSFGFPSGHHSQPPLLLESDGATGGCRTMNQLDPALLIEDLRKTRKYRDICDDTLRRVAVWASERYPRPAERLKAAKRKLHQIHGAFLQGKDLTKVEKLIAEIAPGASENALHSTCREILEFHASTRERVQMLDQLFPELLASAGHIRALLDCACGLNAFAFPWMKLPGDAHYIGTDINNRLVSAINGFFSRVSLPAEARCHDLLCGPPPCKADVALLLKVLPPLEQQHKGRRPSAKYNTRCLFSSMRHRLISRKKPWRPLQRNERILQDVHGRSPRRVARQCTSSGCRHRSILYRSL